MTPAGRILIALAIAAALFLGGYFLGKHDAREDEAARKARALEGVITQTQTKIDAGQAAERKTVARKTKTESVFNGIRMKEITYAQSHRDDSCSLDDDGLRLWANANAGADTIPASNSDSAVPAAADASERKDQRPADQSHQRGEELSRLPGSASGADRMAGGDR